MAGVRIEVGDRSSHNQFHESALIKVLHWLSRGNNLAVAEHRDAIGQFQYLVQHVADEQHARALIGNAPDLTEQGIHLASVE